MRKTGMLLLTAAMTLGACGDDGNGGGTADETPGHAPGESAAPSPSDPQTDAPETASCTNDRAGYSLEYPATWHTNPGEVTAPCTLFDPEPIEVEEGTEATTAITMSVSNTEFQEASAEDAFGEVRSRDSAVVDDREAVAVVDEATGQALLDEGTLSYTWVVDVQDGAFVASTYDSASRDFQTNSDVLDDMISSLDFSASASDDAGNGEAADGENGDAQRTVVARYEGGGQPFDVIAVQQADELCLVARAGGSEGEQICWSAGAGTEDEGTVGFRTSGITGSKSRGWAAPLAQSETERVVGELPFRVQIFDEVLVVDVRHPEA